MMEISSGIIVFRKKSNKRLYLLLHYQFKGDYWDFPRGNLKDNETSEQAAIRETREETGLSEDELKIMEGFEEKVKWFYKLHNKPISKYVTYLLAETKKKEIKISKEHAGFKWLVFEDALRLLRYNNSKKLLLKAEKFLNHTEK
jgi:8-oxo-dGTP pyrophosphatase MutT (NUDIX family)